MLIPIDENTQINSERIDKITKKGGNFYVYVNGEKHLLLIPYPEFMRLFDQSEKHKQFFAG